MSREDQIKTIVDAIDEVYVAMGTGENANNPSRHLLAKRLINGDFYERAVAMAAVIQWSKTAETSWSTKMGDDRQVQATFAVAGAGTWHGFEDDEHWALISALSKAVGNGKFPILPPDQSLVFELQAEISRLRTTVSDLNTKLNTYQREREQIFNILVDSK